MEKKNSEKKLKPSQKLQHRRILKRVQQNAGSKWVERKIVRLDDAMKSIEDWSPARVNSYSQIDSNPNAYYYRFNAPGEKQRTGEWSEEEEALFERRMNEVGVEGNWGRFSMAIPGRVGYQCSNFYRFLIKSGRVEDDNYYFDDEGTLRFRRKQKTAVKRKRKRSRIGPAPPKPKKTNIVVSERPAPAKQRQLYKYMEIELVDSGHTTRYGRSIQGKKHTMNVRLPIEEWEKQMAEKRRLQEKAAEHEREKQRMASAQLELQQWRASKRVTRNPKADLNAAFLPNPIAAAAVWPQPNTKREESLSSASHSKANSYDLLCQLRKEENNRLLTSFGLLEAKKALQECE